MLPEVKKAFRDPFKRLAKKAEDPQVRWFAQFVVGGDGHHRAQAEELVKALPMTLDELDRFGDNRGWNGASAWVTLYEEAAASGLFVETQPDGQVEPVAANEQQARESWVRRVVPREYQQEALRFLSSGNETATAVRAELRRQGLNSPLALSFVDRAVADGVLTE